MITTDQIKQLAAKHFSNILEIRRHLHAHPELSFQEHKTAAFVEKQLAAIGIESQRVFNTGVVALIRGKNPEKKVIALRADLDALGIQEKNNLEYQSINPGVMHACGHDVHTASLLGTAHILYDLKNAYEGSVKLLFQPAEEIFPGGAKAMIEAGVLENPRVDAIIGQHVYPELDAGEVGMKTGKYMASTDELYLTIKGKGGHGALPHMCVDPVTISAQVIIALQQIVSRYSHPNMPTVLSFGRIIGNGQMNVIPDEVKLSGILRTFDEKWRSEAKEKLIQIASGIAEGMGGQCDIEIRHGYPSLVNDEPMTKRIFDSSKQYLGDDKVKEIEMRTTAEDFSYFANEIPATFYRLGIRNKALGIDSKLHSATFNVDESSLQTGMGLMAWLTLQELNNK